MTLAAERLGGRYELTELIAKSQMSSIYKARDSRLARPVAVKVLAPALAQNQDFINRFRREAQVVAGLDHPNIVKVYDHGRTESQTYFIVMELIEGGSLAELLLERKKLKLKSAKGVVIKIATALDFAHKRGVIHRDIKPSNILITADGRIKVVDFGIAHLILDSTSEIQSPLPVLGTATYFSPEQAAGGPLNAASDLYSLGVVFYEMLVGEPPFRASSPTAVAYKHLKEPPPPLPPEIPAAAAAVVMKLLAKRPTDRFQSGAEFLQALLPSYSLSPLHLTAPYRPV